MHVVAVPPQPTLPPCRFGWALQDNYCGPGPLAAGGKDQILQAALASVACPAAAAQIVFEAGSAPRLRSGAARLSLAHSGSWLLAGSVETADQGPVNLIGVDVEQLWPRDFARLESFLNWRSGAQVLQDAGISLAPATWQQQLTALFYRRWTLAEALYKAHSAVSPESADKRAKTDFRELEAMAWQAPLVIETAAQPETGSARNADWLCATTENALGKCDWQLRWQRVVPATAEVAPNPAPYPAVTCVLLGQTLQMGAN